jgi:predicted outer membrane protein
MKITLLIFGVVAYATLARAADMPVPAYLSARPIDNVTLSKSDREFMNAVAVDLVHQRTAAEVAAQFASSKDFVETAHQTLDALDAINADLAKLAKTKSLALPLAGSIETPKDLQKVLDSRNGALERNYEQYAERSSLKLLEKFYRASKSADDRDLRAFALRHVRPVYGQYKAATWLDAPSAEVVGARERAARPIAPAPVAAKSEPRTNAPLAAVGSPVSPGASR